MRFIGSNRSPNLLYGYLADPVSTSYASDLFFSILNRFLRTRRSSRYSSLSAPGNIRQKSMRRWRCVERRGILFETLQIIVPRLVSHRTIRFRFYVLLISRIRETSLEGQIVRYFGMSNRTKNDSSWSTSTSSSRVMVQLNPRLICRKRYLSYRLSFSLSFSFVIDYRKRKV